MKVSLQGVEAAFTTAAGKIGKGDLAPAAVVELSAAALAFQATVKAVEAADEVEKDLVEVSSGA
jgi:hypothetical protein